MSGVMLDSAAAAFCADVKEIARQYREESAPIVSRYDERLEQLEAEQRAARAEFSAEAMEINKKYRARIEHAAHIRKAKYAHPEQIDKAVRTICIIMGGVSNDLLTGLSEIEADNARLIIENAERERIRAEEEKARYEEIKPGRVW